jgi:hypothetical protein
LRFSHRDKDRQKVQKGKKEKARAAIKVKIHSNSGNGSRKSTARRRMENRGEDCDDQSVDSRFPTENLDKETKNRKKKSHARVCVCARGRVCVGLQHPFQARAREKRAENATEPRNPTYL